MAMLIYWWERGFGIEHHGTIRGKTIEECWRNFENFKENHDLSKYTPLEIVYIYEI